MTDCSCYYSENFYIRAPVEGHFSFTDAATFERDHRSLLSSLTPPAREVLFANLQAEAERRHSLSALAAARKQRIVAEYRPLHPELWTLSEAWLHPRFVELVRAVRRGDDASWQPPHAIAPGVYSLPVFSEHFCTLLCEELEAFERTGLPCGRPNSMNRFGALLDELGFSPKLLNPLVDQWLRPLAAALPPLAAAGGASLDSHKSFVVTYRMGEDEHLAQHFDNAEVTLNVNLGVDFDGGELVFYGEKDVASSAPVAHHEWTAGIGHGVLHLGQQVHAALPLADGERRNLVIWMRSSSQRRSAGCPMCDRTDRLLF